MLDLEKLNRMSEFAHLEPAEETGCVRLDGRAAAQPEARPSSRKHDPVISQAVLPNGQRMRLLKTLLTSACERNCYYCPFRAGRDFHRETFKPEELAATFMALAGAGIAQGIFLSSGIAGGSLRSGDLLLAAAEILRQKYRYRGYIHLKLMPGAEFAQVEQAMRLANRVSVNLEAPNHQRLELLAPRKEFMDELLQPLRWVEEIRRKQPGTFTWNGRWPSSTTQFVVGAVGENDLELLTTTSYLYQELHLARAYFSAFHPVPDTPFENLPAETPQREQRLYQASFLLRDYGFSLEELPFDLHGSLPLWVDPKTAWAQQNLAEAPLEINQAAPEQLLRIPGIGPKGTAAIIRYRRQQKIRFLEDLRHLGINPHRPAPFILMDGQRPARQLAFF